MRPILLALPAMALALAAPSAPLVAEDPVLAPPLPAAAPDGSRTLDVMTYNVHGLPWLLIGSRSADLRAIGENLRALRAAGAGPQVVVLQEAFTHEARAIGRVAGFRYIAKGPRSTDAAPGGAEPAHPDYRHGEGLGAWLSSGLVILSDYPIVSVHATPFARDACAGYDCLANKGVALARIAVPGMAAPVQVVTAHLNSREAARTSFARSNQAFYRQVDAIGALLRAHADPAAPMILAGDFNIDRDAGRLGYFNAGVARWFGAAKPARTVAICRRPSLGCTLGRDATPADLKLRTNDWQFASGGTAAALTPVAATLRFQPVNGHALSDHQALEVRYRLAPSA